MTDATLRRTAERARDAAQELSTASPEARTAALEAVADALVANEAKLLAANERDLDEARSKGMAEAMLDRLSLSPSRIAAMAAAVREVAAQADPVGEVADASVRPNGLRVSRVRMPLGVIAVIYEARPNVTSDAAALAIRSGNAILLKGGSEAKHANLAIGQVVSDAIVSANLPAGAVQVLAPSDRAELVELLQFDDLIDLVIPRGGEGLIRFVAEHSRIPVIKHYKGVCHLYLDATATAEMAVAIAVNGKTSRPSVCNATETLLVHAEAAPALLPAVAAALGAKGVTLHACERALPLVAPHAKSVPATDEDWAAEYLTLDLAVRVVNDLEGALDHIRRWGSDHTEAIVTQDAASAERFKRSIRSSCVMVNASTRFNDGGELGLGAEIGISTTRLHAYGPMGARELTTLRFVVEGEGQIR